ncbi:DUF7123 family protein [Halorussus halophilus]|uniref:DUF7123 family protein n=1 Tax=Halorussus halophilus TaxID=2650975 RepID=UPI0013012DC9|nr:hypothetical protein [Halorussus halophilus]
MSATTQPSEVQSADAQTPETASKKERLQQFLTREAADGEMYFKSKFIADEVGLSSKEIGALMVKLKESATNIEIEKWSYTSATTWRVCPA